MADETNTEPGAMRTAREYAAAAWCELTLGNIAVPANADAAIAVLERHIEQAISDHEKDYMRRLLRAIADTQE